MGLNCLLHALCFPHALYSATATFKNYLINFLCLYFLLFSLNYKHAPREAPTKANLQKSHLNHNSTAQSHYTFYNFGVTTTPSDNLFTRFATSLSQRSKMMNAQTKGKISQSPRVILSLLVDLFPMRNP